MYFPISVQIFKPVWVLVLIGKIFLNGPFSRPRNPYFPFQHATDQVNGFLLFASSSLKHCYHKNMYSCANESEGSTHYASLDAFLLTSFVQRWLSELLQPFHQLKSFWPFCCPLSHQQAASICGCTIQSKL